MPLQEVLVAGDELPRFDVLGEGDGIDLVHEPKRRPVRQQADQRVGVGVRHEAIPADISAPTG